MKEIKQEICRIMKKAHDMGMITARDGNLSYRFHDMFFITPSGVKKNCMDPNDIVEGTFVDGKIVLKGDKVPSGEFEMHKLIHQASYSHDEGTRAVLHLHPTYTIAAAYRGLSIPELCKHFPEITRYTRVGKTVPVLPICSSELANATIKHMCAERSELLYDIVTQDRHGVASFGKNPSQAFEHIERLEHICKIALVSGL